MRNVLMYTLGNVCVQSNTRICTFNDAPDPYVNKRSQEFYDALNKKFNIVSWACGRYGQRQYSKELGMLWSKRMLEHLQKTRDAGIHIDFCIQMCGHPTMVQPYPYFIFSDFMPYVDISCLDIHPFHKFTKQFVHEQDELYQNACGVICLTPLNRRMAIDYHGVTPERATVICSGVKGHTNTIKKDNSKKKVLLWVGSDFKRKAGMDVLQVFNRLKREDPRYELHMVGIEEKIAVDGVHVYPFLMNENIQLLNELYEKSSLFVMPSYRENAGLVYFEALAYGTPVIGTTRGGGADIIRRSHCGEVVVPGDVDGIYRTVKYILSDSNVYHKYSANAVNYSENNTKWDTAASRIENAIESWLSNRAVPEDYIEY